MSQSIQTYFLYYKGGFGYVLNGSEALASKAQIRFHPLFLVPPESGLLFGLKFEILID